ncbi:MAG: exosortase/archaeosortase family protein [Verrucomicrobiales bacterium]
MMPVAVGESRGAWRWVVGATASLGCLAAASIHMHLEWTLNETYHYGWWVPVLMSYLIWLRWNDRPPAAPAASPWLPVWVLAALSLIALWIVREANPDWRLIGLALAALSILVSLLWLREAGGWPWVRHFAGALAFFALACPWPTPLELAVVRPLMTANAVLSLEALHWLGVPAARSGTLVTLPAVTLGVEEACSGIRSLQATLMMAFFLGEMLRLKARERALLLGTGVVVALLTNVLRTVFLSTLAAGPSPDAADRWHDRAGWIALAVHAATLFALAHAFARTAGAGADRAPLRLRPAPGHPRWPVAGPAVALAGLAIMGPLTSGWYTHHGTTAAPEWSLRPPESAPRFQVTPIPQRTRQLLRYQGGWSARWRTPQGHQLHGFFLTWGAGQAPPEILHSHEPGNCLTLAGMTLVRAHPEPLYMEITPDHAIKFQVLEFSDRGRPLHVFHAVEETIALRPRHVPVPEGLTRHARLHAAWTGQRNEGLRLIEVGIWNAADVNEARRVMSNFLNASLLRAAMKH